MYLYILEKEMATHSSVIAWRIPGMGEPGGLPSTGSHRVGHNWSDLAACIYMYIYTPLILKHAFLQDSNLGIISLSYMKKIKAQRDEMLYPSSHSWWLQTVLLEGQTVVFVLEVNKEIIRALLVKSFRIVG